jgi:hypothetical protein
MTATLAAPADRKSPFLDREDIVAAADEYQRLQDERSQITESWAALRVRGERPSDDDVNRCEAIQEQMAHLAAKMAWFVVHRVQRARGDAR